MADIKNTNIKKYCQKDLRRLLLEQKTKTLSTKSNTEKIVSPLAKYDNLGNLNCVICRTIIKSSGVWKAHINSKHHKQKVEEARYHKTSIINVKEIEVTKNADTVKRAKQSHVKASQAIVKGNQRLLQNSENLDEAITPVMPAGEDLLPEKFFDDPFKDAKVRDIEYKDQQDIEWDKFQQEIREQSVMSNAIVAEEQYETAVEREIEEIDEQMEKWSRLINLETKKDLFLKTSEKLNRTNKNAQTDDNISSDDESFNEFSNWRSRKFN